MAYHCRLAINETNGASEEPLLTLLWQYSKNGDDWTTITGSTPVQFVDNANLTDGGATTNRDPTGTGTFVAGRIYESANTTATCYTSNGNDHTEALLHFQIDAAQVGVGDELLVRVIEGNGTIFGGTYTNADINVSSGATTNQGTASFTGSGSFSASSNYCPYVVLITDTTKGDLNLYSNGSFSYDYTSGAAPDTDSFQYQITDDNGTSNTATVSLTIDAGSTTTSGTASFTGASIFSATGDELLTYAGTADFSGAGIFSGIGSAARSATADFSATSSLSGSGSHKYTATASFTGQGDLSASAQTNYTSLASFSGSSNLDANGQLLGSYTGTADFISAGSFNATGSVNYTSTASFTGSGSFVGDGLYLPSGEVVYQGASSFTGSGSLSGSGSAIRTAAASFTGSSALSGDASLINAATASFGGASSLVSIATPVRGGVATFSGASVFNADGTSYYNALASFTGGSSFSAIGDTGIRPETPDCRGFVEPLENRTYTEGGC